MERATPGASVLPQRFWHRFRVEGSTFEVSSGYILGFGVWGLGLKVGGLEIRDWGLGLGVQELGLSV